MIRNEEQSFHAMLARGWDPMQHALHEAAATGTIAYVIMLMNRWPYSSCTNSISTYYRRWDAS